LTDETQEKIEDFVTSLTGAHDAEVRSYLSDISSDEQFLEDLTGNWDDGSGVKPFSFRILGVDLTACRTLYALCRALKPQIVVETGVAGGISSSYILRALDRNKKGRLCSVDVPWYTVTENWKPRFTDDQLVPRPIEKQSGWMIPDYLRGRWQLVMGKSADRLIPLLDKLGAIDMFFHDSQHTYETMIWEFENSWPRIKEGGVLIAHNTNRNEAFSDFGNSANTEMLLLSGLNPELGRETTTGAMRKG